MSDEQQTQADDPSGSGWRSVTTGGVTQDGDMVRVGRRWSQARPGETVFDGDLVRRRIEQQAEPDPDDPSGPRWRDVEVGEVLQHTDMFRDGHNVWAFTENTGLTVREGWERKYRRRIEPQPEQPSDSEPETVEDLRQRLEAAVRQNVELADSLANEQNKKGAYKAILKRTMERAQEAEALLAEAERSGEQVNAELQQLREQVQTLTTERDRLRNQLAGAIEHSDAPEAQARLLDRLEAWLRPVIELVEENPESCAPLAVAVLGYLPLIAARLIEE